MPAIRLIDIVGGYKFMLFFSKNISEIIWSSRMVHAYTHSLMHSLTHAVREKFVNQLAIRQTTLTSVFCLLGLFNCKCYFSSSLFFSLLRWPKTLLFDTWCFMLKSEFIAVRNSIVLQYCPMPSPSEHLLLWNTIVYTHTEVWKFWHFRFQYAVHFQLAVISTKLYRVAWISSVTLIFSSWLFQL